MIKDEEAVNLGREAEMSGEKWCNYILIKEIFKM